MRRLALMIAFPLSVASVQAQTATRSADPAGLISAIYRTYLADTDTPGLPGVYSRRLQALIDADIKAAAPKGEVGRLDFDVFVNGNDWRLAHLRVSELAREGRHARVKASFDNHEKPQEIVFDLVQTDGRWLIDEVRSTTPKSRWTLSKILTGAKDAFPDEKL